MEIVLVHYLINGGMFGNSRKHSMVSNKEAMSGIIVSTTSLQRLWD